MPWYELFCLARPQLARASQAELFKSAANSVIKSGGVLTDLKNFGERRLAYDIRRPGVTFSDAFMWQITFIGNPASLPELEHFLRIDERVLRHIFVKKEPYKAPPTTYSVKKKATQILKSRDGSQPQA